MIIRTETENDYKEIEQLVKLAFLSAEHSDKDEHNLVSRIRNGENYIPELSLIAENDNKILGHLMLSKINIENDYGKFPSLALAPVSVLPEYQKQGLGTMLIKEAIKKAESLGHASIVVLGYPLYYSRFGFKKAKDFNIEVAIKGVEEYLMFLPLCKILDDHGGKIIYGHEFFPGS